MHVAKAIRPQIVSSCQWVTSAPIPTRHGTFEAHVFHGTDDGVQALQGSASPREHIAMVYGDMADIHGATALPVRVHSECMTSEVFGSLKCDCKEQLESAMAEVVHQGRGAILYLRQEGRGIGLTNKIRAYGLQAQGYDTVDANRLLGFPDDLREYDCAADMLAHFDVKSIRLMTNNPDKVDKLRALGIEVVSRIPVLITPNPYSAGYLEAKRIRMAHELPARDEKAPASQKRSSS
jgi:GTP cyclohydrolase II